jgi:hypothetical protein
MDIYVNNKTYICSHILPYMSKRRIAKIGEVEEIKVKLPRYLKEAFMQETGNMSNTIRKLIEGYLGVEENRKNEILLVNSSRAHTHTEINKNNPRVNGYDCPKLSNGEKTTQLIITEAKVNKGLLENLENNIPALESIIKKVAGNDSRTIKKYKNEIIERYNLGLL